MLIVYYIYWLRGRYLASYIEHNKESISECLCKTLPCSRSLHSVPQTTVTSNI